LEIVTNLNVLSIIFGRNGFIKSTPGEGEELAGDYPGQAEDQPEEGGQPHVGGGGAAPEARPGSP
jgi:hypothetical protein